MRSIKIRKGENIKDERDCYSCSGSSAMLPYTERKRVVLATKLRRCLRFPWVERRPVRFCSSSTISFIINRRAAWCAGQWRRKCATVSSCSWHIGHVGESALLIRWRCLLSGACPVISWVMMLVCFRGRRAMLLK